MPIVRHDESKDLDEKIFDSGSTKSDRVSLDSNLLRY